MRTGRTWSRCANCGMATYVCARRGCVPPKVRTRAGMMAIADAIGATVTDEIDGRSRTITIDAPAGKVWSPGLHGLVFSFRPGCEIVADAYEDLAGRMRYGVEACDDPACDTCAPDSAPDDRRTARQEDADAAPVR